jgi:diaminopimelate epimerase
MWAIRNAPCSSMNSRRTGLGVLDQHSFEVRFYERGAGETLSSGTGSTGAAAAAILRKLAESPVTIHTQAGDLSLRWDDSVYLTGPAEIVGEGSFFIES